MNTDPWHFERSHLAESALGLLVDGPAQALALFGPRRTGKTEFLIKDLGPLAESRGHRVIYASFWQSPLSPLAALLHALEISRREGSLGDRVRSATSRLSSRLELSAPLPGASAKAAIDLSGLRGEPPADLLLYLDDLLGRLARPTTPTLLMLDEVQDLARDATNRSLVAALRTSLDTRSDGLVTVFTGSSREALKAMFSASEAPFFHFATPLDLPRLGDDFVDHLLTAFAAASTRVLDREAALEAFGLLHRNPFFFRRLLELLLLNPALTVPDAAVQLRERIAEELGYNRTWISLTPIQRALALTLARGTERPFSQSNRDEIGVLLNGPQPSISRVQTAMRKLAGMGLAVRWTGSWALDDPEFVAWVREHGEGDL